MYTRTRYTIQKTPQMPLYSIILLNVHTNKIVDKHFYLKSFSYFTRSHIKEFIQMISQEVANRLQKHDFQTFTHSFDNKTVLVFAQVFNDHVYVSCADGDYPINIGKKFISEARRASDIDILLKEYQDPKSHDVLENIQNELRMTKEISIKTLNSLLERNEKLEDLVEKSEQLSSSSKIFYKAAHKRNRCC